MNIIDHSLISFSLALTIVIILTIKENIESKIKFDLFIFFTGLFFCFFAIPAGIFIGGIFVSIIKVLFFALEIITFNPYLFSEELEYTLFSIAVIISVFVMTFKISILEKKDNYENILSENIKKNSLVLPIVLICLSVLIYNDYVSQSDERLNSSKPYKPAKSHNYFKGHSCTDDCSGHEAGYQWAEENLIDDLYECTETSESFTTGCEIYVNENY